MPRCYMPLILLLALSASVTRAFGQQEKPVTWTFRSEHVSGNEHTLVLSAVIRPGWHMYSQHMEEGGPLPTRVSFDPNDRYTLAGTTTEKGIASTHYNSLYEMDITWLSDSASYRQRIRLTGATCTVTGTIEYMTCNDNICIPAREDFSITIPSPKAP